MSKILAEIAGRIGTLLGYDGTDFRNLLVDADGNLRVTIMTFRIGLHGETHENGGDDEIDVTGLSGVLGDDQPSIAHTLGGAKHLEDTLADLNTKISDANVDDDGDPRDPKDHAANHENGGGDEISVGGLSGLLADGQTPLAHDGSHEYGGGDELDLGLLGGAIGAIEFVIDGGGAAITIGEKGHLRIPFIAEIQRVTLLADQEGSIVVDIWRSTIGTFPPTNEDSLTSATPPTITGDDHSQDETLTDWTTTIPAGSILAFNVDSCATIERVTVALKVRKARG